MSPITTKLYGWIRKYFIPKNPSIQKIGLRFFKLVHAPDFQNKNCDFLKTKKLLKTVNKLSKSNKLTTIVLKNRYSQFLTFEVKVRKLQKVSTSTIFFYTFQKNKMWIELTLYSQLSLFLARLLLLQVSKVMCISGAIFA